MGQGAEGLQMVSTALGRIKAGQYGEAMEQLRRFGIGRERLQAAGLRFTKGGEPIGKPEDVMRAVEAIGRGRPYLAQMIVQMDNLAGKWSNFKDAIYAVQVEIGQHMTPGLKYFLDLLAKGVDAFVKSEAYQKLLRWLDEVFSKENMDRAFGKLVRLVAGFQTAAEMAMGAWGPIKALFSGDLMPEGPFSRMILRIAEFADWGLKIASIWYGVASAIYAVRLAFGDLTALAGMLASLAVGGAAFYAHLRLRGWIARQQRGLAEQRETTGGTPETWTTLYERNLTALQDALKGAQVPSISAMDANTDATNANTRAQLGLAEILRQIIGGGPLARAGIPAVEVERMRRSGRGWVEGGGRTLTIHFPASAQHKMIEGVKDIVADALAQLMSESYSSYEYARSGG